MSTQEKISSRNLESLKGKVLPVLVTDLETEQQGYSYRGRLSTQAPEVDGSVFIKGKAQVGKVYSVLIQDSSSYDLLGTISTD